MRRSVRPLGPEQLAYWYLRLNGFLTLQNYVVHPDRGVGIRTDIDVLAVRFPYRSELFADPMQDDADLVGFAGGGFGNARGKPLILIGEAKTSVAALNRSWLDPGKRNIERFLGIIGAIPSEKVEEAAHAIYTDSAYGDDRYNVSLLAIGSARNPALYCDMPGVLQITWRHIASFVFDRFDRYARQKWQHEQWDGAGKAIWSTYRANRNSKDAFCDALLRACALPSGT